MRLSTIREALDRRSFLKTAAAVAGAPNKLGALGSAVDSAVKAAPGFARQIAAYEASGVNDFFMNQLMYKIIHGGYRLHPQDDSFPVEVDVADGEDNDQSIMVPRDVVTGYLASHLSDETAAIANLTGTAWDGSTANPLKLDQFDGVFSACLKSIYENLGPEGFVQEVLMSGTFNYDYLHSRDGAKREDSMLAMLRNATQLLPDSLGKLIDIEQLKKGQEVAAKYLFDKGLITKEHAKEIIGTKTKWAQQRKYEDEHAARYNREQNRLEHEKMAREKSDAMNRSVDHERATRNKNPRDPDLSRWADDGGTALENKLNKALKKVIR